MSCERHSMPCWGFAQLLRLDRQHPLTDGQRSKVELIERAGGHLLGVISDVLDLSRIDSGSLPLSIEPVVVAHVLDEAVSMVGAAAQDAGGGVGAAPGGAME